MSCTCAACREHARTLGLARLPASKKAIHRAYRSAAKLCHPDRFANDEAKFREAEERFKSLQEAYRELNEHFLPESLDANGQETQDGGKVTPDAAGADGSGASEAKPTPEVEPRTTPIPPQIPFGSAPGCYSVSQFPPQAQAAAARHLGLYAYAVAIADLSGDGSFDRFFLLASHGVIVKDASGRVSLLHYEDLGKMDLVNRKQAGKIGFWEKIAGELTGVKQKLSLEIFRRSGIPFCSLTGQLNDAAKVAIYQYLSRKKLQYRV
jgi:curved DNA-binding protein CbpA